jgi:alanine dehydrogenase
VQSVEDPSKIVIAGATIKDGWRLVGEADPVYATEEGFCFYANTPPAILLRSISYQAENILGEITLEYTSEQLASVWLHKEVLIQGLTVNYVETDNDEEDSLTVSYRIINPSDQSVIAQVFRQ